MSSIVGAAGAAAVIMTIASCAQLAEPHGSLDRYVKAKAAYAAGRLADAEAELAGTASENAPPQARFLLGKVKFFLGKREEAIACFAQLRLRFPRYHEADIWLARCYLQGGEVDEAERLARDLIANDASDPRLYYLDAMIQLSRGDAQSALGLLERSAECGEELAKSCFEAARLYYRFGQDDRAIEKLLRAKAALPPGSPTRPAVEELLTRLGASGKS